MEKTFAQLKKDLTLGRKVKQNYSSWGDKLVGTVRPITKVQSNAVRLDNSWLYYPKTSKQVEYVDNVFRFYKVGKRPLNEKEKAAVEEWKKITQTEQYKKDAEYDAYTDYNGTYYQQKWFWEQKGMKYMFYEESGGLKRDMNDRDYVWDNSLKGELEFEYEIVE